MIRDQIEKFLQDDFDNFEITNFEISQNEVSVDFTSDSYQYFALYKIKIIDSQTIVSPELLLEL